MDEANKTAIARFFEAILTDEALAAQVAELAGKAGYAFTAGDLLELGEAQPISDDETAEAAGGLGGAPFKGRILVQQIPLAKPGQLQTDDLVYRPGQNQTEVSTLPCRPDGAGVPQKPKTFSI